MAIGPIQSAQIPMLQPHQPVELKVGEEETVGPEGVPFSSVFLNMVGHANSQSHAGFQAAQALAEGRSDDIHGTMIEVSKASIEMKLVGTVRNKVIDAFYELWRMSV